MGNENYGDIGHAVHHFVDAIDCYLNCSPLLNRDYRSFFEVRSARRKVLSRKNTALSLEAHSDLRNLHSGSFAALTAPKNNEVKEGFCTQNQVPQTPVTPVSAEAVASLHNLIQQDTHMLNETSKQRLQTVRYSIFNINMRAC